MELILPPGTPTYETSTHNWTRPDNVWLSHHSLNLVISCDTNPSLHPVLADHLPVITIIDMPVARAPPKSLPNFQDFDFTDFNKALHSRLQHNSPAELLRTKEAFYNKVDRLTTIIQETIDSHMPAKKPCPFSKRWWTTELTALKKRKNQLSNEAYKFRHIVDHPSKEEHKKITKEFASAIEDAAKSHWLNWLENISAQQIYSANKYVTNKPSDYSSTRVPSLKTCIDDDRVLATSNADKVKALSTSFFPPLPPTSPDLNDMEYPPPLPGIKFFTRGHIKEAARRLKPFKAPGPDGIPNIVLIKSLDVLINHLYYVYRAVFELDVYHERWLTSTTLVLCKPGKPAYDVEKAYHPIGLLDTMGKLLSTLVATDLSFLAEKHSMLPPGQFGGRSGHNTTDAIHLLTHTIKDAWHSGKLVVAIFLNIQGAFPNTNRERLIDNMQTRSVMNDNR